MKKYILFSFYIIVSLSIKAQTELEKYDIISNYDLNKSHQLTQDLIDLNQQREKRIGSYLNQAIQNELKLVDINTIRDVLPDGTVTYYKNYNDGSSKTIRANRLYTGGTLGLDINGENMTAGLWEAENGYPRISHLDLVNRISIIDGGNNISFHATHVAGTIISSGDNISLKLGRGIAYKANLIASNSDNDYAEMSTQASLGLLVSNHSYGYTADGLPVRFFGAYNTDAVTVDLITSTHPYYIPVVSAGNDRDQYTLYNPTKGGYDLLTGMSNAKNSITSAAVSQVLNYTGPSSVVMSSFSNWGPTDDGRIKPDISSKGVSVLSTSNTSDTAYANSDGTSMSAPAITGLILLLQQYYFNKNSHYMFASTIKGLLLHTADEAGFYKGPDYSFGWGLANGEKAAKTISDNGNNSYIEETFLSNGDIKNINIIANGIEPLKVSISWTDPAGIAENNLTDDRNPDLVNDIDLKLNKDGVNYFPWKLNYNSPSSAATRTTTNDVDNFELVEIDSPNSGDIFTATINHKKSLKDNIQNYSFIVTGGTISTMDVVDKIKSELIVIFPNPFDESVFLYNNSNLKISSYKVVDITGRIVKKGIIDSNISNIELKISDIEAGVYHIVINTDDGFIVKRLIKK